MLGFRYGKGSRPVLQIVPNYTRLYHILRDEYPFPTILALRFRRFGGLTPACEVRRRSRRFFLGSDRDFTCKDEKVPLFEIFGGLGIVSDVDFSFSSPCDIDIYNILQHILRIIEPPKV